MSWEEGKRGMDYENEFDTYKNIGFASIGL